MTPRLGIGAEMVACDVAARFLGNLTKGSVYRAMPPEQRTGFRRAMQELKYHRDTLGERLRRHGIPVEAV